MSHGVSVRTVIVSLSAAFLLIALSMPGLANSQEPQRVPAPAASVDSNRLLTTPPLTGRERPCANGKVEIFDCQAIDLLSFLPREAIGISKANRKGELRDVWGWTDSATGREFALVGWRGGLAFVEVTEPVTPVYLGASSLAAQDMKVYKHYAFVVSESDTGGMRVFDLTQLLTVHDAPATIQEAARYRGISQAHNIAINEATGFAYTVMSRGGDENCGRGLHMIDIRTPTQPVFAGCYAESLGSKLSEAVHDAQCVVYRGPDQRYRGREICLNAAGDALGIVDVTDKRHPKLISIGRYPNVGYTHQGWLSEDHRYFFLGDEGDEIMEGMRTRTIIFDLRDLDDPVVAKEFLAPTGAMDHNQYVRGHYLYQANYRAGLRVLDIHDPVTPKEVGYFDTAPLGTNGLGGTLNNVAAIARATTGAWTAYPYFKSGAIAVSSIHQGLFLVRFKPPGAAP